MTDELIARLEAANGPGSGGRSIFVPRVIDWSYTRTVAKSQ